MSASEAHQTRIDPEAARALVERLADFLKISGLYPANNARVQQSGDGVVQLAEELRAGRPRLILRLTGLEFSVDMVTVPSDRANVAWLRDSLRKTAVTGLALGPGLTRASLLDLAAQLRTNTAARAGRATTFDSLWPKPFDGVEVLERRFLSGAYGWRELPEETRMILEEDSPQGALLRHMLESTDSLSDELERIQQTLDDGSTGTAVFDGLQIIQRIVDLLPPDLLENPQTGLEIVQMVLSAGGDALLQLQQLPEQQAMLEFRRLILEVSSRYFGRGDDNAEEATTETDGLKGHAGDELITDSVEELLAEIETLPDSGLPEIVDAPVTDIAEKLNVCLHHLLHSETDADLSGTEAHLAQLLPRLDEPGRQLLASYFGHLCSPTASKHLLSRLQSLLALVERLGLSHLLLSYDVLTPRTVIASFPAMFGPFLDILDVTRPEALPQLEEVCRRIGRDRLRKAEKALFDRGGVLTPERQKKLFALPSSAAATFAVELLRCGDSAAVARVARYLAGLRIPGPEAEALRVIDPPEQLPRTYLTLLSDCLCSREPPSTQLLLASEELIRGFILEETSTPEHAEKQARAVAALRAFWSNRTRTFAATLRRRSGFLWLRRRAKPIRLAAKQLLLSNPRAVS